MRNLKRALSLALASVMLLGMMVVGTSASYADVTSKQNKEAIEVAQAVGVMVGDDKGNFNPDAKVTRVEMAVVMSNLLNLKVNDFKAAKIEFTDVPAWAAPYVAACKADGIIAGYSATYFGANDTVTAAQAALMMMKALGYFQFAADFGDDWQLATVKQASKIKLYDGINASAATALTRNDVAQLVLNALEANMVETDGNGGTTIKGDGFEITTGSTKYTEVKNDKSDDYRTKAEDKDEVQQLIEKLFEDDIEKDTEAYDDFGRPATTWTYTKDKKDYTVTAGDKADYTFVIEKNTTLADLIDDEKLDKKITDLDDKGTNELKAGTVVELFVNDSKKLTDLVAYTYVMGEITKVEKCDAKDDEDAIADGAQSILTVKIDGTEDTYYDIQLEGFNAKTYVKNAKIAVVYSVGTNGDKDDVIVHSEDFENLGDKDILLNTYIPTSAEGKVTAVDKNGEFFRLDGSKYVESATNADSFALNNEGTFYLDSNGFVIGYTESEDSVSLDDVVFVRDTFTKTEDDSYGTTTTTYYAQVVKVDGTVENLVVGKDGKDDYGIVNSTEVEKLEGNLYSVKTYTAKKEIDGVNYKGCSKLTAWPENNDDYYVGTIAKDVALKSDDTKAAATVKKVNGDNAGTQVRLNSKTTYVMIKDTLADIEVSVKTGGVKTTLKANATVIATKSSGNYVASYVFLPDSEAGATSYDDVIYVDNGADAESISVADKDCVKFDAYDEAGKKIAITIESDSVADSGFYTYSIDEDGIYELEEVKDALTENDGTGVKSTKFVSYYTTLLTVEDIEDIETKDATIIDIHDTDADGQYNKTISSLSAMKTAVDKKVNGVKVGYVVSLDIYADDGAVIIVVTDVSAKG